VLTRPSPASVPSQLPARHSFGAIGTFWLPLPDVETSLGDRPGPGPGTGDRQRCTSSPRHWRPPHWTSLHLVESGHHRRRKFLHPLLLRRLPCRCPWPPAYQDTNRIKRDPDDRPLWHLSSVTQPGISRTTRSRPVYASDRMRFLTNDHGWRPRRCLAAFSDRMQPSVNSPGRRHQKYRPHSTRRLNVLSSSLAPQCQYLLC